MQQTLVFVYGTLLQGERNHHHLHRAELVGGARTRAVFTMIDLGSYPAMVRGGVTAVVGEVYRVDERTLAALDELEGHPTLYRRERIELDDGRAVETYLLPAEQRPVGDHISSGDFRGFKSRPGP